FAWDVAPGFYDIAASHAGCRAATPGGGRQASTGVLAVPPERTNLTLTLRCPHLHRAATRLRLKVVNGPGGMRVLSATVNAAKGRATLSKLVGAVTFTANGRSLGTIGVDVSRTAAGATLDLPSTRTHIASFAARYSGNGLYAPSRARVAIGGRGH